MTEKDAQQIIEQTKRVKINVVDKITLKDVTLKNQKITVQAPTDLGEGLLVVIDLINKDWGKIITLAYDVKANEQGLISYCAMPLRKKNSVSKKKKIPSARRATPTKKALRPISKLTDGVIKKCASAVSRVMPQRDLGTKIAAKRRLCDS